MEKNPEVKGKAVGGGEEGEKREGVRSQPSQRVGTDRGHCRQHPRGGTRPDGRWWDRGVETLLCETTEGVPFKRHPIMNRGEGPKKNHGVCLQVAAKHLLGSGVCGPQGQPSLQGGGANTSRLSAQSRGSSGSSCFPALGAYDGFQ